MPTTNWKPAMNVHSNTPLPDRKEKLIQFIKESKFNQEYVLPLENVQPEAASIFIQGMRVHLSKLKAQFRARGKVLKAFKMKHVATRKTETGCEVVLLKATNKRTIISDGVNEAFSDLFMEFDREKEEEKVE